MQSPKTTEVSLLKVTKPLLTISRLFGMNPRTRWHKIYTVFILVCEICFQLYSIWQYHTRYRPENYHFSLFVHSLQNACRLISLVVILGTGLFDRKRFMIPVKDFVNIDKSLKRLGGRLNERNIYRLTILLSVCVGLMPFFVLFGYYSSHSSEFDFQVHMVLFMSWSQNLIILITCAVADCGFTSTLSIISQRFRAINLIIHRFETHASYSNVDMLIVSRYSDSNETRIEHNILQNLITLRKQYHDLWRIANRVNNAYGLHLLVTATTSLAVITSKLWELYSIFTTSNRMTIHSSGNVSWIVFSIGRIFLLAKACQSTIIEAKATYVALQELWMKGDHNPQTKAEIRDFFMQLQLEAQNFTACGFFNIDCTLVSAILGAICTYLVILIQMGSSNVCVITQPANESVYFNHEDHS